MAVKIKRKKHKLKKGPGRKGSNPRTQLPRTSVEDMRDSICVLISIDREKADKGKPLRKWELAHLQAFLVLVKDIVKLSSIDPLKDL